MALIDSFTIDDAVRPVEIADRIWWVGHYLENDRFQCHVYLIENGDQSVLIDPGSKLTISHTLEKIAGVTDFNNIKYFICQHQDPDITGAMPQLDEMITRDDAVLVSHWRAEALLKHYDLELPFWRIEDNEWKLDLPDRTLRFIFTPYAHFPGAFCTFDESTGLVFSSDIFGGFTSGFSLLAQDESYFENLRPFHEHYMPSREILAHALDAIMEYPVKMIAPQHGSIIPERLIDFLVANLKNLDCGLYMLSKGYTNVHRLSTLNKILRDITHAMIIYREFRDIAHSLLNIAKPLIPISDISFYSLTHDGRMLHLAPENRYLGTYKNLPDDLDGILNITLETWIKRYPGGYRVDDGRLILPLFGDEKNTPQAVAIISLHGPVLDMSGVDSVIELLQTPLQVAVERETIFRSVDMERQAFYERSIRDSLTGLYTRYFMNEAVLRMFSVHDREPKSNIGLAMIDIDHFKLVNDKYGHIQGDEVLKAVAEIISKNTRGGDISVRFGGEEFAVFMVSVGAKEVDMLCERIRQAVEKITFDDELSPLKTSVSIGTALRLRNEELNDFIERADIALYLAKSLGRNQVCAG